MRISDWSSDVGSSDLASDDHLDLVASHRRFIEKCDGNEATVLRRDFRYRNVASFRLTILREQAWHFRVVANLLRGAFQPGFPNLLDPFRSEEHTSELQSLMRISYAVFCLKKKKLKS